jgi:Spy/CpxP family protein refolding chaperone
MKRKLVILGVILLIAINMSVLATVGYRWRCGPEGKTCKSQAPCEYLCAHLSLSDSQREKMELFGKALDEKTGIIREALRHKRNKLVELLNEPSPDRVRVDSLIEEIGMAQAELEKEVMEHIIREKEILTPEQQKKFLELISRRLAPEEKCERVICPP